MSVVQPFFVYNKLALRIEHDQVCVISRGNSSFAGLTSGQAGRSLGHPAHDVEQGKSALVGIGPDQWQSNGKTGNPSPSSSESTLIEMLHGGRARGMVGCDQVDDSILQSLPELFTILPV